MIVDIILYYYNTRNTGRHMSVYHILNGNPKYVVGIVHTHVNSRCDASTQTSDLLQFIEHSILSTVH